MIHLIVHRVFNFIQQVAQLETLLTDTWKLTPDKPSTKTRQLYDELNFCFQFFRFQMTPKSRIIMQGFVLLEVIRVGLRNYCGSKLPV